MGNGKYARSRHHHRVLDQKKAHSTKRRAVDVDQISTTVLKVTPTLLKHIESKRDVNRVGKGENYCMPCERYFMNMSDLAKHERSKLHKKRLKYLKEPQYSHAEAEQAGGLGSYRTPQAPVYPVKLSLMTTRHKEEIEKLETQMESSSVMGE